MADNKVRWSKSARVVALNAEKQRQTLESELPQVVGNKLLAVLFVHVVGAAPASLFERNI
ncbi:MAG: hypothetical protein LUD52_06355 [Opitutae bacterium]|nr:hypothetical protein [Opitutae bacterium]